MCRVMFIKRGTRKELTVTHSTNIISGTIAEVAASRDGALDGFEFRCECGEVARFSAHQVAVEHALGHANYMAKAGR